MQLYLLDNYTIPLKTKRIASLSVTPTVLTRPELILEPYAYV